MDHLDVPTVPVADLPGELTDDTVLLDVREEDEWRLGHVAGARHIPMGDVPARMHEIDTDKELFVICHSGGRSHRVSMYLQRYGYEPANVDGGLLAWVASGRPLVTDDGAEGTV